MRIVILASSIYSETSCAAAVRLADAGFAPVGALTLSTWNAKTLLRKARQWGVGDAARYARSKIAPERSSAYRLRNSYLNPLLHRDGNLFRNLRQVASAYNFPVATCGDQNAPSSVAQLRRWAPDLMIFTGGNILRQPLLAVPRLGVLNAHLGLLPEIRGMSSPEWSLLTGFPAGVTIHYMDAGIDTGPILRRCELPDAHVCSSLADLRNRLIAFGIEKIAEVVSALEAGKIAATPQPETNGRARPFFVMHELLQARAAKRGVGRPAPAETVSA
ncbi:MAG TPA: formyltransferase family protein [Candidatus Binatia bacterium]|nr:formyltransferase family protein [Candidatus Binatia bacterium]